MVKTDASFKSRVDVPLLCTCHTSLNAEGVRSVTKRHWVSC